VIKTGSGRRLQWAIEIEQGSMWEASMWFGPFAYWDRDHTLRQVDWLTVDTLDAGASTSPDMFWSLYIQPTLTALLNNEYEDDGE
jgi:hypothetical protein